MLDSFSPHSLHLNFQSSLYFLFILYCLMLRSFFSIFTSWVSLSLSPSVFIAVPITMPGGGFPGVFVNWSGVWLVGRGSGASSACEASRPLSGVTPVIGTRKTLSSFGTGLFSIVGMSPYISRASMASFVLVDIAGVSTVFDLGAGVSLVDG